MKRGEVWTASGSGYAGKPRTVVILQDDPFHPAISATVCPLTSSPEDASLVRIRVEPDDTNGLEQPSFMMIDKLTTVPVAKFGRRLGQLPREDMQRLDSAAIIFLGLGRG
jgi:mRNA interferase MazF